MSKMLKSFDGEGDVAVWLAKVELVAKLSEVKDVANLVALHLEGSALSLYLELDSSKQSNFKLLSEELLRAYSDSQIVSFSKLRACRWEGESVDVYANSIRKLARGAGFTGDSLEHVVKLTIITGFPESVSKELQQVHDIDTLSVSDVLARARVLTRNTKVGEMAAPAMGGVGQKGSSKGGKREPLKCYECGGPHLARHCAKKKTTEFGCYECGGPHLVKHCDQKTENQKKSSNIACSIPSVSNRKVPVISVVVDGKRARALVDTGCTTTMVCTRRASGKSNRRGVGFGF